ncbi:hypothetical protein GOP47_0010545 [Adiantum capillus-veneris]|uniref:Uncharacterized protein n=1 Tax=Adiantum capillus-veneris TaxID=13818 RepID=A0A9D4UV36_ADICA|nr:hypothetical protein GOP47_0010545 [Adiantum capillus-veneris]
MAGKSPALVLMKQQHQTTGALLAYYLQSIGSVRQSAVYICLSVYESAIAAAADSSFHGIPARLVPNNKKSKKKFVSASSLFVGGCQITGKVMFKVYEFYIHH